MSLFGNITAVKRVEDRLAKCEQVCDDLARNNRRMGLEYIELYDKVRHQMSRMAKRTARDAPEINAEEVAEIPDDGIDPISRKILALRGGPRTRT